MVRDQMDAHYTLTVSKRVFRHRSPRWCVLTLRAHGCVGSVEERLGIGLRSPSDDDGAPLSKPQPALVACPSKAEAQLPLFGGGYSRIFSSGTCAEVLSSEYSTMSLGFASGPGSGAQGGAGTDPTPLASAIGITRSSEGRVLPVAAVLSSGNAEDRGARDFDPRGSFICDDCSDCDSEEDASAGGAMGGMAGLLRLCREAAGQFRILFVYKLGLNIFNNGFCSVLRLAQRGCFTCMPSESCIGTGCVGIRCHMIVRPY